MTDEPTNDADGLDAVQLEICPFCYSGSHTSIGQCPNIDPEQLAVEIGRIFVELLRDELTADEFAEMQRRNATAEYERTRSCASHDFRDANMIMAQAFVQVGLDPLPMDDDGSDDDTDITELWNRAWESAMPQLTAGATE
jgi:hypothetical protein